MGGQRRGGKTPKLFGRDERGGIVVTAALVMMPLTLLSFAAVEFHNYTAIRSDLQDALDAATLAVARSPEKDPAKQQILGTTVLERTLESGTSGYAVKSSTFNDVEGEVTGRAELTVTPIVSSLFSANALTARADSKASRLGKKLEIALVLDNTYSMLTNDRLGITKTAASNFVDTLSAVALESRVTDALKISVVPYSTTVNVGAGYANASWMDRSAESPIHQANFSTWANRFTLFTQMGQTWAGCVESRPYPYDVQDSAPSSVDPNTLFVPYFAPDEHDDWTQWYVNDYLPDGSVSTDWVERQNRVGKYNQAPLTTADMGSGHNYGPNYGCKLQPVVRLTTDMAKVKAGINGMVATGDTYSNVGLMWGWHTLSPNAPFADGVAYSGPVQKIVVLMTDGENAAYNNTSPNASIYSGGGFYPQGRFGATSGTALERRAALDARMAEVCTNLKAKGVVVYTIRVEVTGGTGDALRNCATDTGKFFDVTVASQLNDTFTAIANTLLNLRIAS